MIKEIRIGLEEALQFEKSIMEILKERGFPVDDSALYNWKPKTGLKYFEFHDPKTDEIVVQWEDSDSN